MRIKKIFSVIIGSLLAGLTSYSQVFTAGSTGMSVQPGTILSIDSLVLVPSSVLTITSTSLSSSPAAVSVNGNGGINEVFTFSSPITYNGTASLSYAIPDLNGNAATTLVIAYNSAPAGVYTLDCSSVADVTAQTVTSSSLGSATLANITAVTSAISVPGITGTVNVCAGNSGTLADATAGGTWSSASPGIATVSGGTVTGIAAGTAVISYTVTNGCNNAVAMAVVTVNSLPNIYPLTLPEGGLYCAGGAGVPVGLSGSDRGVSYQLYLGTSATITAGSPVSGTGTAISFGNQAAGVYVVIGTNTTTGCAQNMESTATIATTPLPTVTAGAGIGICLGASATLGATGGSTYSWSPAVGLSCATCSGTIASPAVTTTYTVTGTNAAGCSNTATVTVTVNPLPAITPTIDNVTCNGLPDGYIEATASGSAAPYSYTWSTGGAGVTLLNNLYFAPAGVFTVTATDANGCSTTAAYTITQPPALSLSATTANVTCYGNANGSITTTVTGGTPAYSYLWSTGSHSATPSGLSPGAYLVAVTDAHGCITAGAYTITQPAVLSVTAATTNVTCNGGSNGSINTTVTGGTLPYAYHWSNGASAADLSGLAAGTYSVTVTDGHGCTTTGAYTISQPVAISLTATTSGVTCNGGSNGSINTTVSSGVPAYTFAWSNGSHAADPAGLSAGTYSVTVTDERGCTATGAFTIGQPSAIVVAAVTANVSCNGSRNGSIATTVSGGTAGYSYTWSGGSRTTGLSGLAPATYTLTVTDAHGCTAVHTYTITQPAALGISATVTNASCTGCSNGSINTTVSGGTPAYSYTWSDGAHVADPTGLAAGTYSVTVTDANGCTVKGAYTVTQPTKGKSGSRTFGVATTVPTDFDVSVAPNPNKGVFSVKGALGTEEEQEVSLEVVNMLGQVVYKNKVFTQNGEINELIQLTNAANGMYMLNLSSGNQHKTFHLVVIQ